MGGYSECKPSGLLGPRIASCPLINKNQSWPEAANLLDFAELPCSRGFGWSSVFQLAGLGL